MAVVCISTSGMVQVCARYNTHLGSVQDRAAQRNYFLSNFERVIGVSTYLSSHLPPWNTVKILQGFKKVIGVEKLIHIKLLQRVIGVSTYLSSG